MQIVFGGFLFLIGCFIGSFLNVIIDRLPEGKSFIWGRSHCDYCRKQLHVRDLVPVFSFVFLHGRCRYCHHRLSYYYPISELLTGCLFAIVGLLLFSSGVSASLGDFRYLVALTYYLYITSCLVVIFFTDLRYGIIPFKVVLSAVVISVFWYLYLWLLGMLHSSVVFFNLTGSFFFMNYLLSGLSIFVVFLLLFVGTKARGIGFGDVVFVSFMGFLLGFPKIVLAIYVSFLTGAVVSLILVLLGKKRLSGGTVPFGPFLVFGTFLSLLYGDWIIRQIMVYLLHV